MSESYAPTKRAHQAVTDDLILRIDAALEKTQGHRAHAAHLLGIEKKRLGNVVNLTPALKAKWGVKNPEVPEPGLATEIHRDPAIPPFTPEELEIASAWEKQAEIWERGLEKLNFTQEKRDFLEAVQASHGGHWKQMTQMFKGGVCYSATELLYQLNKLFLTIEDTYANPEKYERKMENQWGPYVTKTAHEVRMELLDRALSISDMYRKLNGDAERAELINAQIERLKSEDAEDVVKKRKKASFARTPIEITTEPMAGDGGT